MDINARVLQFRELLSGGSPAEGDKQINFGPFLTRRILRILQPYSDGKISLRRRRAVQPSLRRSFGGLALNDFHPKGEQACQQDKPARHLLRLRSTPARYCHVCKLMAGLLNEID